MNDFVKTVQAQQAMAMCQTVMAARDYERMGQITGEPGTGKSALTKWIASEMNGIRIECWSGMTDRMLINELARAFVAKGFAIDLAGTSNTVFVRLMEISEGQLILVDEANHLYWQRLEKLRAISDKTGAAVILCGTDLLARRLVNPNTKIYTDQLRGRIGTKRVVMEAIRDDAEFAAYILAPRFGRVGVRVTQRFRQISQGNWRTALGLADACQRLMENENLPKLDEQVVETAAAWMAGQS